MFIYDEILVLLFIDEIFVKNNILEGHSVTLRQNQPEGKLGQRRWLTLDSVKGKHAYLYEKLPTYAVSSTSRQGTHETAKLTDIGVLWRQPRSATWNDLWKVKKSDVMLKVWCGHPFT